MTPGESVTSRDYKSQYDPVADKRQNIFPALLATPKTVGRDYPNAFKTSRAMTSR